MVQDAASQLAINKPAIVAACAAVCSPAWLPSLHDVSAVSAEILPIVGLLYLLFQFANFLVTKKWHKSETVDAPSKHDET